MRNPNPKPRVKSKGQLPSKKPYRLIAHMIDNTVLISNHESSRSMRQSIIRKMAKGCLW